MALPLLHIVRWPNLLMVAGIQTFIYLRLLTPESSALDLAEFSLLSLITVLISASGYVINDYFDAQADRVNRPHRWIAGNYWSFRKVKTFYFVLLGIGMLLSVFLGQRMGLGRFIWIYILAVAGLWIYSYTLKCKPLAGNLWVALYCAAVIVIVALPDLLLGNAGTISQELWYYAGFAFLSTWYREVVKDLEDVDGDALSGCQTFIVRFGMKTGKILAGCTGIFLLLSLAWWALSQTKIYVMTTLLLISGAVIVSFLHVLKAKTQNNYHDISARIKFIMLAGTLVLLL